MKKIFIYGLDDLSHKAVTEIYSNRVGEFLNALQINVASEAKFSVDQEKFEININFPNGGSIVLRPLVLNTDGGVAAGFAVFFNNVPANAKLDSEMVIGQRMFGIVQKNLDHYPKEVRVSATLLD